CRGAAGAGRGEEGGKVIRRVSVDSLELHSQLAEQGLDTGFARRGTLNVYATAESFAGGRAEAEESGLEVQVLGPSETLELEPALVGPVAGSTYYTREALVEPYRFVHAVGRASGADLRTGVGVASLRRRKGRVSLEASDGLLEPETVVLAAGVWSSRLARGAGVFVPLEGGKGYHIDLERSSDDPRVATFLHESWTVATPHQEWLRLSGTLEL